METKKISLNTSILPILNVGLYGSALDPNGYVAESFYDLLEEDDKRCSDDETFDFDAYCKFIGEQAERFVKSEWLPVVRDFGVVDINCGEWYHPREYNFYTDSIDLEIEVVDNFEELVAPKLKEICEKDWAKSYIRDNWKSRSGFISFMPQDYDEIVAFKNDQCYAAALTLLSICEGYDLDKMQEWFEEICLENINYEDFAEWKSE